MFFFSSLFAGIEITPTSFRVALLKKNRKGDIVIHDLKEIPRDQSVNLLDILPSNAYITTSLGSQAVLTRQLKLPLTKENEIQAGLEFQAESLLPYPLEKGVIAFDITEKRKEGSTLTLFAVKKDLLTRHLEELKRAKIEPDSITANAAALTSLSTLFYPTESPSLLVHLGEKEGCAVLHHKGHAIASRAFDLEPFEIQKTFLALESSAKLSEPIASVLLVSDKKRENLLSDASHKNVCTPNLASLNISQPNFEKFSLAIGIALTGLRSMINFRQKEFLPPFPWRRFLRPLLSFSMIALALTASLFFLERKVLHDKERILLSQVEPLAHMAKIKRELPIEIEALPSFLDHVEQELSSRPNPFPLLPLMPKTMDVLAWLSTLPSTGSDFNVRIEEFNYLITQRPDFTHKEQPYLAKVELLLSTPSPATCQEWLKNKNPFLDPQHDLEWRKESEGKFRAIFFLKDRTRYNP